MYSFQNDYSEGAHPRVLQALTDGGCADWFSIGFFSWNDPALDVCFWKLCCHDLIVHTGHQAGWFFANIAAGDAKGFGNPCKYGQIQTGVAFDDSSFVLLEIAWEGGTADDIGAAFVVADIA